MPDLCKLYPSKIRLTTKEELEKVLKSFNSNKAADSSGITAEHMKYASDYLTPPVTEIINHILEHKMIPSVMKEGVLTPIEKKGKGKMIHDNHRGITVLAIIE